MLRRMAYLSASLASSGSSSPTCVPGTLVGSVLLNGPQFVEDSRVMGAKLLAKHADDPERLVVEACRLLTSRRPSEQEAAILGALFAEQMEHFEANPEQASALLKTGAAPVVADLPPYQQAAAAVLVNAIMNLDETVTKR